MKLGFRKPLPSLRSQASHRWPSNKDWIDIQACCGPETGVVDILEGRLSPLLLSQSVDSARCGSAERWTQGAARSDYTFLSMGERAEWAINGL